MKIKSLLSYKIILALLLVFCESSAQQVKSLDKRKFIAWTVDHMPYHILVEDAIVDYNTLNTLENPRIKKKKGDKKLPILKEMRADDLLICLLYTSPSPRDS